MYIGNKIKRAAEVGMDAKLIKLSNQITQVELEDEIDKLNKDHYVDGIIVQVRVIFDPPYLLTTVFVLQVSNLLCAKIGRNSKI